MKQVLLENRLLFYAFISHEGESQHGGQYFSYVKDKSGKWWKVNDLNVSQPVTDTLLLELQNAIEVFYVRKDKVSQMEVDYPIIEETMDSMEVDENVAKPSLQEAEQLFGELKLLNKTKKSIVLWEEFLSDFKPLMESCPSSEPKNLTDSIVGKCVANLVIGNNDKLVELFKLCQGINLSPIQTSV
jgi:hypothetical protein